jgi:hypothetical protein
MGKKEDVAKWAKMSQKKFEDSVDRSMKKEAKRALESGAESSDVPDEPKDASGKNPIDSLGGKATKKEIYGRKK